MSNADDFEGDPHAMLSYSWADDDVVTRVEEALGRSELRVWRDKSRLGGGAEYAALIEIAVQRSGIMLVFGSPSYEESVAKGAGCAQEIVLAVSRMQEGRPVLGVNVGPAGYSPHAAEGDYGAVFGRAGKIGGRLWVDLREGEAYEANLRLLVELVAGARRPFELKLMQRVGGTPVGASQGGTPTSDKETLEAFPCASGGQLVIAPPLYEVDSLDIFWGKIFSPAGCVDKDGHLETATPQGWQFKWRRVSWSDELSAPLPGPVHKCSETWGKWHTFNIKLAAGEYIGQVGAAIRGEPGLSWPWCLGYLEVTVVSPTAPGAEPRLRTFKFGRLNAYNEGSLQRIPAQHSPDSKVFGFHGNTGALVDALGVIVCERSLAARSGGSGSGSSSSSGGSAAGRSSASEGGGASGGGASAAPDAAEGAPADALRPGRYRIFSKKAPAYCLDGKGGHGHHAEGTQIITFPACPENIASNQKFDVRAATVEGGGPAGPGLYTLSPACCGARTFVGLAADGTLKLTVQETIWAIKGTPWGYTIGPPEASGSLLRLQYAVTALCAVPAVVPDKCSGKSQKFEFVPIQ